MRERLQSARTRFRDRKKVETAVAAIIVGLLAVYFFALILQSLLERELRQAMAFSETDTLPLSPEGRHCSRPTTRQLLDVFEPVTRQTLYTTQNEEPEIFNTELAPIHLRLLKPLRIPANEYHA